MSSWQRLWDHYRRLAKMSGVPAPDQLRTEFDRRKSEDSEAGDTTILTTMLNELEDWQKSIDNSGDAILKVGAFLGTGLAVLAKLDDRSPIPVLSVIVVLVSGFSLGAALFAQNSPVWRALILVPPTFEDLKRSCRQLLLNQICLGLASILIFIAIAVSLYAVTFSLLQT